VALHAAAGSGHAEVAELLIDRGGLHSPEDESGWTPLHLACHIGSVPTVRALLGKQARLEARGPRAMTPLMLCCSSEGAPVAQLLLHAGADANAINRDSRTALFEAVSCKSLEVCKMLLDSDVNVNRKDDSEECAFHQALDWPAGLELLLASGADPNMANEGGCPLLHEMALRGHLNLVKQLVEKGAELEAETTTQSRTALHAAASAGHFEVVAFLISKNVNVDHADKQGNSPLHLACMNGSVSVTQALVNAKCSLNAADVLGNTALHHASGKGHDKCVSVIKVAMKLAGLVGERVENLERRTPLHLAAESGSYACVSILLEACPDGVVEAVDSAGKSALHYSLRAGDVDSSTSLIWAGCSPSLPDVDKVLVFFLSFQKKTNKQTKNNRFVLFIWLLVLASAEFWRKCFPRNRTWIPLGWTDPCAILFTTLLLEAL
jgi:ankyrin repeat protein